MARAILEMAIVTDEILDLHDRVLPGELLSNVAKNKPLWQFDVASKIIDGEEVPA